MDAVSENSHLTDTSEYGEVHSGSTIDRTWRWTMVGFILGVLPQAIKIFGSQGIPYTQALVGIQLATFVVLELFRAMSGPACAIELHPMPSVVFWKRVFVSGNIWEFYVAGSVTLQLNISVLVIGWLAVQTGERRYFSVWLNPTLVSPLITLALCKLF